MTPEQEGLLKKARDSIEAAKLLSSNGFYDFSVSRTYYSMFYIAEAFLLGEGLSFSKHSDVIAAFGQKFARTKILPQEFHGYLIEAETGRHAGDYDISSGLSEDDAIAQIIRAEKFLGLAEKYISDSK